MEEKRIEDEEPEKQKKRTKSERIKSTNRGVFVLFYKMKPNNYKSIRFSRLKGWSGLISMFFYIINSRAVNDILTSPGSSGQSRCAVYSTYGT